jgi:hypothetical protein
VSDVTVGAIELAANHRSHWNLQRAKRLAESPRLLTPFIGELPLSLDIIKVQRIGVRLIEVPPGCFRAVPKS